MIRINTKLYNLLFYIIIIIMYYYNYYYRVQINHKNHQTSLQKKGNRNDLIKSNERKSGSGIIIKLMITQIAIFFVLSGVGFCWAF